MHNPIAVALFITVIVITLLITRWAARRTHSRTDFYAAGSSITGVQNGLAIAGDFMSASTILGVAGLMFVGNPDAGRARLQHLQRIGALGHRRNQLLDAHLDFSRTALRRLQFARLAEHGLLMALLAAYRLDLLRELTHAPLCMHGEGDQCDCHDADAHRHGGRREELAVLAEDRLVD